MDEKNARITTLSHACKGYAITYIVEILNFFNPKLQRKESKSTIKNKLIDLLSGLGGFKFVTILALNDNKMTIKQYIAPFTRTQKQKQIIIKVALMMCLNKSILLLYKT